MEEGGQLGEEQGAEGLGDDQEVEEGEEGEWDEEEDEEFVAREQFVHARSEEEQAASIQEVFAYLTEGRPRVSPADLSQVVQQLGVKMDRALLQEVILEATGGETANLTEEDFTTMLDGFGRGDLKDELKEIWILAGGDMPVDDHARLQQASLGKALRSLGAELSDAEVESLVAYVGGEDGELDYSQFVRLLAPPEAAEEEEEGEEEAAAEEGGGEEAAEGEAAQEEEAAAPAGEAAGEAQAEEAM